LSLSVLAISTRSQKPAVWGDHLRNAGPERHDTWDVWEWIGANSAQRDVFSLVTYWTPSTEHLALRLAVYSHARRI
jgi:hypothetical protein